MRLATGDWRPTEFNWAVEGLSVSAKMSRKEWKAAPGLTFSWLISAGSSFLAAAMCLPSPTLSRLGLERVADFDERQGKG